MGKNGPSHVFERKNARSLRARATRIGPIPGEWIPQPAFQYLLKTAKSRHCAPMQVACRWTQLFGPPIAVFKGQNVVDRLLSRLHKGKSTAAVIAQKTFGDGAKLVARTLR